ncbi:glycosyltransferase [Kineococcus sp. LSe6-4]|uniref:Glycosyltransferase n=1 Tax=Kineococcus halophytocola TaxID=3234027 RepID=A0ABV4GXT6_9ACTN
MTDAGTAVLVTSVDLDAELATTGTRAAAAAVGAAVERALSERPDPGRCTAAWVLVWSRGRPAAVLELPLPLDVEEVARELPTDHRDAPGDPSPSPAVPALPTVSVVVPTVVQRVDDLDRCLTGLEALRYPGGPGRVELLLVDNRPVVPADDPLPALLARHPRVRRVPAERPGISQARNAGLAAARGEVVAFTDDDVRVDPGWLLALGTRFATHPEEDVVTGLVVPAELETPAQRDYEAHYGGFGGQRRLTPAQVAPVPGRPGRVRELDATGSTVREFPVYGVGAYGAGANMAFRRTALPRGFDVRLGTGTATRGGEDLAALVEVLWRGGRLGYEPAAVVHHSHRRDRAGLERQLHGNGVGFTAMLTALVCRDRRHLGALAALVPGAAVAKVRWALARAGARPTPSPTTPSTIPSTPAVAGDPRRLVLLELRGMPWGPLAYWRTRTTVRPVPQEIS